MKEYTPQEIIEQTIYILRDTLETLAATEAVTTQHLKTLKKLKTKSMIERTIRGLKKRIQRHNKDLITVIAELTYLYKML